MGGFSWSMNLWFARLKQRPDCVSVQTTVFFLWAAWRRSAFFLFALTHDDESLFTDFSDLPQSNLPDKTFPFTQNPCMLKPDTVKSNKSFYDLRINSSSSSGPCWHEIKASCPKTLFLSLTLTHSHSHSHTHTHTTHTHTHTHTRLRLTRSPIRHLWTVSNIFAPCNTVPLTIQASCYVLKALIHIIKSHRFCCTCWNHFAWIRALFTGYSK